MAVKKSQLYSALWSACDKLRGGMDASQYKDYVLVILFVKYISDKAKNGNNQLLTVPAGCSFDDLVALKNKPLIGESVNKILAKIAEANGLTGVLKSADFSDENKLGKGKDLVTTVSSLIQVFENDALDLSNNRAADDDIIGDAYEYLMKQFASQSGKSKGQFYTPAEVSRIMAKLIGISSDSRPNISIYDPTCGSGSLLLRAKSEAKTKVSLDGQEKDLATIIMAKMSMIIHGDELAELRHGDTLNNPLHTENDTTLEQFDYVVANPPFSQKAWMKSVSENDIFHRWGHETGLAPVPPSGCGDYAFLLHIIASLKPLGHGACILPHGVLFRGGAEQDIRKWLISKQYISGIVGLPQNLFYGTNIPACIIILDKEHCGSAKGIFMIDAKEGYQKDGAKNRLREEDIKLIVDTWNAHKDVDHYARFVEYNEIKKNDYNLNIPRYITTVDKEIHQDIYAHLQGGIPAYDVEEVLESLWNSCPTLKDKLFLKKENGYYSSLKPAEELGSTIIGDESFLCQKELFERVINGWCDHVKPDMLSLNKNCEPKRIIEKWSNSLLENAKKDLQIVDPYNVYEVLMIYWAEILQDDCYIISRDGWTISLDKSLKKKPTYEDYSCDLLPVSVMIDSLFKEEKLHIEKISEEIEQLTNDIAAFEEEHQDDIEDKWISSAKVAKSILNIAGIRKPAPSEKEVLEGLLPLFGSGKDLKVQREDYINQNRDIFDPLGSITKGSINKRLKDLKDLKELNLYVPIPENTQKLLKEYCDMSDNLTSKNAELKAAKSDLSAKIEEAYKALSEPEIKNLVVNHKWIDTLKSKFDAEMNRVANDIATEITNLCERYAQSLADIDIEVSEYEKKVVKHLAKMGF